MKSLRHDGSIEVVDDKWLGTSAIDLTFKDAQSWPGNALTRF